MTLYLVDANVLIRANEDYYPLDRIPAFWPWLVSQGAAGVIKLPPTIYSEVGSDPRDPLGMWARDRPVRDALVLAETVQPIDLQRVFVEGYRMGAVPTDAEQERMGRDPFLIAAALGRPDRVVVTRETSRPSARGANRKVPDVCRDLRIRVITDFQLWKALDFRIP